MQVPDQRLATLFYVAGIGLTRDPYLMVSDSNMWVNVGRSQFHLPTGRQQVLRGHTGIVIAGRQALLQRLAAVAPKLEGTAFSYRERNDHVEAICPWATGYAALNRTPNGSGASRSACPMSSSRCRAARLRRSAGSILRSWASPPAS
ncbi:hypothetical protein [Bradyrhizobium sp. BR 1433]|uniref:hypothetical protein n=1 Tax=Bradyrhizobium sp. BR 1433 TaxID=3447967 RepID=UPI003EE7001F